MWYKCRCIKEMHCMNSGNISTTLLDFYKGEDYTVDFVYGNNYIVGLGYGWDDYINLSEKEFNEYFELINE